MLKQPNCLIQSSKTYNTGGYKKGYQVEGTGLDTYIGVDNGGFTTPHQVATQLHPGNIYYPSPEPFFGPNAQNSKGKQPRGVTTVSQVHTANVCPIKYNCNGTGRDTYIYNDNGGFAVPHTPSTYGGFQKSFVNSLRAYAHPASRPLSSVQGRNYNLSYGA